MIMFDQRLHEEENRGLKTYGGALLLDVLELLFWLALLGLFYICQCHGCKEHQSIHLIRGTDQLRLAEDDAG
jgi:hypothetical protein